MAFMLLFCMTKKKKPKLTDATEKKSSQSNLNYEHAISEVEALRAILKKVRKNDEPDKEEKHGNK